MIAADDLEWLEADGLGGFSSGTSSGIRTRRYHALLLTAVTPPTGRIVLVNGFDACVDLLQGSLALSSQRYAPGVLFPDGASRITRFTSDPWPTWEYELAGGVRLLQEILVQHGTGAVLVAWTLTGATRPVVLRVRPFLSGRDYHALHHENPAFTFSARQDGARVTFGTYEGVPSVTAASNGAYRHAPEWYRQFLYTAERARGLDDVEDLASPGEFSWTLPAVGAQAVWLLSPGSLAASTAPSSDDVVERAAEVRASERIRRDGFPTALDRAADAYLVRRGAGRTIVAGYPWFTDWGRDTFVSIRGLCLATGRLADACAILVEWAGAVSEGMLPNLFTDHGEAPEFNSVDASLWYIVAVHDLLTRVPAASSVVTVSDRRALETAVLQIIRGYIDGTRFGIRMDADGLLAAGAPGVQLTWMDARVGDRVVTPRAGKPVEVQALWLNALAIASRLDPACRDIFARGTAAFHARFWSADLGRLADVVDVDHVPGTRDDTFRPNQILAVGGLPVAIVDGERGRRVVDAVEARLITPLGLRSLAPGEPGYAPRYEGGPTARDAAYHQGTVWPWLLGPFVEAWVRVRGDTNEARRDARARFVAPVLAHLQAAGIGHVSEIADAEPPFTPKGCPFQAWSLGELLRLDREVLRESPPDAAPRARGESI